jgi:uncharacterized membrane protein
LRGRKATILTFLFILTAVSQLSLSIAATENPVISESLTLSVYLDGFVLVTHELETNQTYPAVNVTLIGENHENLLFLDQQNLPLNYIVTDGQATVYSLGASKIKAAYLTQELTTKTGKYWTLTAQVSTNTTVILPANVTIISLNNVPEQIESTDAQILLVMPPGTIDITYIADHNLTEQTSNTEPPWLLIASLSILSITACLAVFWILKRKETAEKKKKELEKPPEVDLDKLLEREKDLRQEEIQVVNFLAEKNGTAFEAEIYEKLQLPRTTTWRLLKRLEKMEILDIKKSRRQNTVSIRKKYLKTSKKP